MFFMFETKYIYKQYFKFTISFGGRESWYILVRVAKHL